MQFTSTLFLILLSFGVHASDLNEKEIEKLENHYKSLPLNTFRFIGNQIVCKTESVDDDYACHRIGHLKVGGDYKPKIDPQQELELENGVKASVFPIVATEKEYSYLVVGHKSGTIVSVQFTGTTGHEKLTFASINLTDSKEHVEKMLGHRYRVSKVDEIGGELWDYFPFPISIEFKNDTVYSMRVTEDATNKVLKQ